MAAAHRAKAPDKVIAAVLRSIGLRQRMRRVYDVETRITTTRWPDFWTFYVPETPDGEADACYAGFWLASVQERVWTARERIEALTRRAGHPFYVRKSRLGRLGRLVMVEVSDAARLRDLDDVALHDVPVMLQPGAAGETDSPGDGGGCDA